MVTIHLSNRNIVVNDPFSLRDKISTISRVVSISGRAFESPSSGRSQFTPAEVGNNKIHPALAATPSLLIRSLVDRHFCCQAVPLTFLIFSMGTFTSFSSGYLLYLLNSTMNHFLKKKYNGLFCPFTFFSEIQRVCSVKTQYQLKIFIQVHSKISIHTYVAQKRFRFYFSIVSSDD